MSDAAYVAIARRFCDVNKEPSTGFARRYGGKAGKSWEDLVPVAASNDSRSAVVVLAPSGVGKTSEFTQRAQELRKAGVSTFFMRAGDIATSGAAGAVSDAAELLAWKETTARAVFFIDAIDEARAEGHDLTRVLQRFAHDIDPATKLIQLVLSSRNDVWANDDVRHIVRTLALPSETSLVSVVRLEPLFLEDLKLFATARGVRDADAFLKSFRDDELDDLFDLRPPDAQVLVDYWNQHGAFGSWSEMLEAFIEANVRNETASRLRRGGAEVPSWMPALVLAIASHLAGPYYVPQEVIDDLEQSLGERTDLRRAVWQARQADSSSPEGGVRMMTPHLGHAQKDDVEWFWSLREGTADDSLKRNLDWPLREALGRMSPADRARFVERQDVPLNLKAFIDVAETRQAQSEAVHRQFEAKAAAEKATLRAKNIAEVQPMRADIEAGLHGNALVWGWQHLEGTGARRARLGTGRLVEAVGRDLTDAFITGFQRWWRANDPAFPTPGSNTVSLLNLAGLTGLSLEAERGLDFATLTDVEVERATRYALHELNGFPFWFDTLRASHPDRVRTVLKDVVRTEWDAQVDHLGVIHRAPYEPLGTAELVRELVMDGLERGAPGHGRTVHYAIGALLLATKPARDVGSTLGRHVAAATAGDIPLLSEWLRGWSHFAPEKAASWLRALARSDRSRFLQVVQALAALLEDDFDGHRRPIAMADWSAAALEAWVRALHVAVRPEDDIERAGTGVYSPGQRDRAQDFRNRCVSLLARNPTREAFEALRRIRASKEMKPYAEMVDRLIVAQLTEATEHLATAWTEEDIRTVERGDERIPRNNAELFALVARHLAEVARLLENDDFSYAKLFGENENEREVQCWVASSLKLMSRGLYNVERESAVQDAKLMDISIAVPGVGRVPIEIKPLYASRYSLPQLQAFIANQLVARYMRPPAVDRGIFLLVPLKLRTWRDGKRVLSFDELCVKLQDHANRVGAKAYKEVQVMWINVAAARRSKPTTARATKTPPRAARSAKARNPRSPKPGRSKGAPLPIVPKGSARR